MKNNFIILILVVFGSCLFFTECKKYEEDDVWIQWKRPEKRLINNSPWKFEELLENDVNISNLYINDSSYFDKLIFIQIDNDTESNFRPDSPFFSNSIYGTYVFRNKYKYLLMGVPTLNNIGNYLFLINEIIWQIERLDSHYLILTGNYNTKAYRITYKSE